MTPAEIAYILDGYWHLQAVGNNEIIAHGEGYTSEQACLDGIEAVKVNAAPAAEPEGEQP